MRRATTVDGNRVIGFRKPATIGLRTLTCSHISSRRPRRRRWCNARAGRPAQGSGPGRGRLVRRRRPSGKPSVRPGPASQGSGASAPMVECADTGGRSIGGLPAGSAPDDRGLTIVRSVDESRVRCVPWVPPRRPSGQCGARTFSPGDEEVPMLHARDWAATRLGPTAGWPLSLKALVKTVLASCYPMVLL